MLAIKLSRFGKKKQPSFRVVVLEKSKDPWGDYLENLGHYNPRSKELVLNAERVRYWLSKGAQPTNTVHNMLVGQGILEGKKKTATKISGRRKAELEKKSDEKRAKEQKQEAPKSQPAEAPKAETPKTEEKTSEMKTEDKKSE